MGQEDGQRCEPQPAILEVDDSQQHIPEMETDTKTTSATSMPGSSAAESVPQSGRTYHKSNQEKYILPSDDEEQDRLDLQHHLFSLTFDGHLSLAPIETPHTVLDIGTGTGIWAKEYALQNPSTAVTGTDLSPIKRKSIPSNCHFLVADAETEWDHQIPFEYIHGRALFLCFKEPISIFRSAFSSLAPGGYFEMQDIYFRPHSNDASIRGTALESWNAKLVAGAKALGKDWWCTPKYKGWFQEVGFLEVEEKVFYWPGNEWPKGDKQKELGRTMLANTLKALSPVSMMVFTKVFGMTTEEVEVMLVEVGKDMENLNFHTYYPIYVVWGRKPL